MTYCGAKEQLNDKCFIQTSFHLTDRSKYYFHYFLLAWILFCVSGKRVLGKLENQMEPKQTQENTDDVEETHPG